MGVSFGTAHYTVKRDKLFHTCHTLPRSGRPTTFTESKKCLILRTVRNNRKTPYRGIAEAIGDVTERQVCKVANSAGYHHCIVHCIVHHKPFLTQEAVKKRYKWAWEIMARDWDTIIWADKTRLELGEREGQERVTWEAGEEEHLANILEQLEVYHVVGLCGPGSQGTTHPAGPGRGAGAGQSRREEEGQEGQARW